MSSKYDIELMVDVAGMYYDEGLKQDEIAGRVSVSRSSVSLILAEARDNGIVEINIINPLSNNDELADLLKEKFSIKKCFVVPTSVQDPEILLRLVVRKAVDVFNETVKSGDLIGLAWGQTCYQFMTDYISSGFHEGLRVVPLTGGTLLNSRRYQMNEVVRLYSDKISGEPVFFHAPAFPHSQEDHDLYMKSHEMQAAVEFWKKVNIAIISFGAPPSISSAIIEPMLLEKEERELLEKEAAGDICARFYDINGNFIGNPSSNRTIGITPDILKSVESCIAVVTGRQKLSSVIGGLRTGVADTLVIDEPTAKGVLNILK